MTSLYFLTGLLLSSVKPGNNKGAWSIACAKRENKNCENFFWRGNGIFAKIWTRENFPLYGIAMTKHSTDGVETGGHSENKTNTTPKRPIENTVLDLQLIRSHITATKTLISTHENKHP